MDAGANPPALSRDYVLGVSNASPQLTSHNSPRGGHPIFQMRKLRCSKLKSRASGRAAGPPRPPEREPAGARARFPPRHACREERESLVSPSRPLARGRRAVEVAHAGEFDSVPLSSTSSGFGARDCPGPAVVSRPAGSGRSRRGRGHDSCKATPLRIRGSRPRLPGTQANDTAPA